jgi:rhombotail lipoprotein
MFAFGIGLAVVLTLAVSCVGSQMHRRSNALEYLYPKGAPAVEQKDVHIQLPVRVGLAFTPTANSEYEPFTEGQKQQLLARAGEAFKDRKGIASIQVLPTSHLTPNGSFEELDRLKHAFGVDLIGLISYDQMQFRESGKSSITYWTIVGAYVVKGERNDTRTMLDAVVYDIDSRAMLMHAAGQSTIHGSSTLIEAEGAMRKASEKGYGPALDDLVKNLALALDEFQVQAANGSVHGPGTPAVKMVDSAGNPVTPHAGGTGAGASGIVELAMAALLALIAYGTRPQRCAT